MGTSSMKSHHTELIRYSRLRDDEDSKKCIRNLELDVTYANTEYASAKKVAAVNNDKKDNPTSEEVANGDRDQVQPLELPKSPSLTQ